MAGNKNNDINFQWVKDKITLGNLFNRSQQFSRNDSSNSNSSSNSVPVTACITPISTPVHSGAKATGSTLSTGKTNKQQQQQQQQQSQGSKRPASSIIYANRQNSFPVFRQPTAQTSPIGKIPLKLTAKSSSASSINGNTNTGNHHASGSLRRRRFKQQYQARRELSRQTSSGTSLSNSQEYSTSGAGFTANPIIDKLLDYVSDNYAKNMEPFSFQIGEKIRLTSFASFRLNSGQLHGASNFERIGDSKLIKSSEELTQIILASNIMFTDLLIEILFSAKFVRFLMRDKHLKIFIEKCILYVELAIDHTMLAKVKLLRLVSIDGIEARTSGIPFPLNKSFDSFALKTIHSMAANSEQYTNQIVLVVNQFCDNLIGNALKSLSIMDLFW